MMEKINLSNYEAFFLDKVEGNLTAKQQKELDYFLEEHPELKAELEAFSFVGLEDEAIENTSLKNNLKKEESTALPLLDYLMIAEVEGTITSEEKAILSDMVKEDPKLMGDLSFYHKTKITDTVQVSFPEKSALLQKERKGFVWWRYSAAAAAAILFFFFWNGNSEEYYSPRLASFHKVEENSTDESKQLAFIVEKQEEVPTTEPNKVPVNAIPKQNTAFTKVAGVNKTKELTKETKRVESKESNEFANNDVKQEGSIDENPTIEVEEKVITDVTGDALANNTATDEFIPIKEFAKEKIAQDLLKGRTFSETIMDELEEASTDKISFKREKDNKGSTQKFAINIGKFSLSRNK